MYITDCNMLSRTIFQPGLVLFPPRPVHSRSRVPLEGGVVAPLCPGLRFASRLLTILVRRLRRYYARVRLLTRLPSRVVLVTIRAAPASRPVDASVCSARLEVKMVRESAPSGHGSYDGSAVLASTLTAVQRYTGKRRTNKLHVRFVQHLGRSYGPNCNFKP